MTFTVAGTLLHEGGHYLAARCLGYKASLHYNYTNSAITCGTGVAVRDAFLITLAGPLQTMLTGTLGGCLLIYKRRSFKNAGHLRLWQWSLIFLTLFWLRELFNGIVALPAYYLGKHLKGDEVKLAAGLNINIFSFLFPAAIIAAVVLWLIIYKVVPRPQRMSFILAGFIGGLLGFWLWMYILGPLLMP